MKRTAVAALAGATLMVLARTSACASIAQPAAAAPSSPIELRGVVEGFYGPSWPHEDRVDMVTWMGAHGMNVFVHAPLDDPVLHTRWREPFAAGELAAFGAEISAAEAVGVAWGLGIAPGTPQFDVAPSRDVCFACPDDFEVLAAKYEAVHALGVRTFMLRFDDVIKASTHPEDAASFGVGDEAYGRMTGDLANRLQERFDDSQWILTPSDYSGVVQTDYLRGLSAVLDERVLVAWVGRDLAVTPRITGEEARAYARAITRDGMTLRRPLVWDNFPVNDLSGNVVSEPSAAGVESGQRLPTTLRLPSGPLKGREADLAPAISGYLSNPMNQPQASKVPLYTVAAYLNDPYRYTDEPASCPATPWASTRAACLAEDAWRDGVAELGGDHAGDLFSVVNQLRSTSLDRTESPVLVQRWQALRDAFTGAGWRDPWSELVAELTAERDAPAGLRAAGAPSERYLAETAMHLDQLVANAEAGLAAADLLASLRPMLDAAVVRQHGNVRVDGSARPPDAAVVVHRSTALEVAYTVMRATPYAVHGDRAFTDLTNVYVLENRMDEFIDHVRRTHAEWMTSAAEATAAPITVTVNGVAAAVAADGSFTAVLPGSSQSSIVIVATDGAGGQTALSLAAAGSTTRTGQDDRAA